MVQTDVFIICHGCGESCQEVYQIPVVEQGFITYSANNSVLYRWPTALVYESYCGEACARECGAFNDQPDA